MSTRGIFTVAAFTRCTRGEDRNRTDPARREGGTTAVLKTAGATRHPSLSFVEVNQPVFRSQISGLKTANHRYLPIGLSVVHVSVAMGRRAAPLVPRKVVVNGVVQWAVRVPASLRKQEGVKDGRKYLGTEAIAKGYCKKLESLLRNYSDKAHGLTDAQKIEAQECFERLAESPGASLTAAVEMYLTHRAQAQRSVTLSDLGEKFVAYKQTLGGRGSKGRTLREYRVEWPKFAAAFPPDRLASSITPQDVHDWLFGLTKQDGTPLALQTRRAFRRILHATFEFAREHVRRWVSSNPVSEVKLPTSHRERVVLLPISQVEGILTAAHPRLVPYLAICAFAGARPDQAKKMTWEQIHFDRGVDGAGELEVPAGTDKTDRERIVPMQPNLRAWLLLTPEDRRKGQVYYSKDFFWAARDAIGLKAWPQDCLRHDYGTYRFKVLGSFGVLADEMGNSEAIIRQRYQRSVSQKDADAYWRILPPTTAEANAAAYWQIFGESPTALKAEWKWRTHPRAS